MSDLISMKIKSYCLRRTQNRTKAWIVNDFVLRLLSNISIQRVVTSPGLHCGSIPTDNNLTQLLSVSKLGK